MKAIPIAVTALVLAFTLAGCGGDDEASTTTTTTTTTETETETQTTTDEQPAGPTVVRITVEDGVPAAGIVRATVDEGDRIALVVTSDVADEVHVHGYDISKEVVPGKKARIAFEATIPGRFEVELEERGVPIADLTVNP